MKRITILLALLMLLNVAGCGGGGAALGESGTAAGTTAAVTTERTEMETAVTETSVYSGDYAKLAKTNTGYRWIHSFLSGDADGCAAIVNADPEAYSFIKSLTFTDYGVKDIDGYTTEFTFTVKGGNDILPDGEYTHVICSGIHLFEESVSSNPDDVIPMSVTVMLPFCSGVAGIDDFSKVEDEALAHGMFLALLMDHARAGGTYSIPEAELLRGASLVFSTDGSPMLDKVAKYESGAYSSAMLGGAGICYRLESHETNDGKTEYIIRYYHDSMYLVKSHLLKIVTEETGDGVFGTRILSIERIEEGRYDPFAYAV